MRDEVYNKFSSQMLAIIKDCLVTEAIAETSADKYWHHHMHLPINKGSTVYYDRQKVESHKDELKKIITEIPQRDLR